jgi:hypothetical protein
MPTYKLTALTNTDPAFYPTLGPYLANREVNRQLGDTPHDDPGKTWIVATCKGEVAGFIVHDSTKNGTVHTESCYTAKGHDGLRGRLVQAVVKAVAPSPVTATVRADFVPYYTALGFTELPSRYKSFSKLVRN